MPNAFSTMRGESANDSVPGFKTQKLHVKVARSLMDLAPFEAAWNRLAWEAPQSLPTQSYAWVVSYLEAALPAGTRWCCLLALEEEALVGVLPVIAEPQRWLGFKWWRLSTPHTREILLVDFLVASGREQEVIPLLLRALQREYPTWDEFWLQRLREGSPTLSNWKGQWPEGVLVAQPVGRQFYLPVPDSFEAYASQLGGHFRRNLSNAKRHLAKLPQVRVEFLQGAQATEAQLPAFLNLEAAGWKGTANSAIQRRAYGLAYFERLTRRLSRLGWLEWHLLFSGERLLSGGLCIKFRRHLICYKTSYDESLPQCSAGNLLLERTIQRACASGDTDELDFVSDSSWLARWGVREHRTYELSFYPRRAWPLVSAYWPQLARQRLRNVPGLQAAYQGLRRWLNPQLTRWRAIRGMFSMTLLTLFNLPDLGCLLP